MTQTQPKFLTIYNTLYKEIQIGKYPSGHALPTEKELCARFDVSRMTYKIVGRRWHRREYKREGTLRYSTNKCPTRFKYGSI
ncbi:GntR family transcriptional regulator [Staphylococcus aureus]|nr:GntR family transcriptional regulator [Staphylococcus aureus]CYB22180.1 GntR family transcriptional regulator [Staphylococcus aureus]